MLLRTSLVALAAFLGLATAASARPTQIPGLGKVTHLDFELVKSSAERTIDWHYLDTDRPIACNNYVDGSGQEKVSYSLVAPTPYRLTVMGKQVSLAPKRLERHAGEVTRTVQWKPHVTTCADCGGELGACGPPTHGPQPPTAQDFDCGTRKLISPQLHIVMWPKDRAVEQDDLLAPPSPRDWISVDAVPNAPDFKECPPTQTGGPGLPTGRELGVAFFGEYRKIMRAKPGATVTLKGESKLGHTRPYNDHSGGSYTKLGTCPALSGPGRQTCETLKVEIVLKRVRG